MSMNRILIICLLICNLFTPKIYALSVEPVSDVPQFEEPYLEIGYKSVGEALKECEMHHQRVLRLPIKLPSIEFTHHLGRCINDTKNFNDEFQIEYLNENTGKNHYNIDVRPVEQKINFETSKKNMQRYKLNDGSPALYFTTRTPKSMGGFNVLVFEKNGWQYCLSVDSRIENQVTVNTLIEIAESVK
jgi:hypothetical protein